jgi:hypothetical protein
MLGKFNNIPEINRRFIYSIRSLGLGQTAADTFCGLMDLPQPVKETSWNLNMNHIHNKSKEAAEISMKDAAQEEVMPPATQTFK